MVGTDHRGVLLGDRELRQHGHHLARVVGPQGLGRAGPPTTWSSTSATTPATRSRWGRPARCTSRTPRRRSSTTATRPRRARRSIPPIRPGAPSAISARSTRTGTSTSPTGAAFMIVSGGVNIYPQEIEDVLLAHPKVLDVAVFGVPNAEMGEEVKAVVQPVAGPSRGGARRRAAGLVRGPAGPLQVAPQHRFRRPAAETGQREAVQDRAA